MVCLCSYKKRAGEVCLLEEKLLLICDLNLILKGYACGTIEEIGVRNKVVYGTISVKYQL